MNMEKQIPGISTLLPAFTGQGARISSLILTALLTAGPIPLHADTLVLRDGSRQESPELGVDRDLFFSLSATATVRATPVPRDRVSDWWPGSATPTAAVAAVAAAGIPADVAATDLTRLQAWRTTATAAAARAPGAKGVQVLDDGCYILTTSRQHLYRYHFAGLILSEKMLDWGTIEAGFSEGREQLRIVRAMTLGADGRTVQVLNPADSSISKPESGGDVFFNPQGRVLRARIPGVEIGALVEFEIESKEDAPEDWRLFFPSFLFQSADVPVCESRFEVRIPKDQKLFPWTQGDGVGAAAPPWWAVWQAQGGPETGAGRDADGQAYHSWRWLRRDVPLLVKEPLMPPSLEITPAVFATLFNSWDYLDRLVGGMQKERMQPTPELRAAAAGIIAGAATEDAKAAALYHWVQKNIRYISIKSSLSSNWTGHPAAETLKNGYGDCTDKSILLATLLQLSGIPAEPVVLRTNDAGLFVPRQPMLLCNHAITEAHLSGNRTLFLDSTTQDQRYPSLRADDHGALAINFIRGTRTIIPVPPPAEASLKNAEERLRVLPDLGLETEIKTQYAGAYEASMRATWKEVPEPLRRQVMQQYLNRQNPGAVLRSLELPDPQDLNLPFALSYSYLYPGAVQRAGALRVVTFPDRLRRFPEFAQAERRYPVAHTTAESTRRHLVLEVPAGWEPVGLLPAREFRNRHFAYHETWTWKAPVLDVRLDYERTTQRIPVADYGDCRTLARQIEEWTRKPLFFRVASATPPSAAP